MVEISDAAVAVPILDDGRIALIWQYRYPHGETHWEVPAGRIHAGESPAEAAAREVLEETGYRPARVEPLPGFYPINGISDHYAHAFVARGCTHAGEPTPEAAERFEVRVLERAQVERMLAAGEFRDGFTALALFYAMKSF